MYRKDSPSLGNSAKILVLELLAYEPCSNTYIILSGLLASKVLHLYIQFLVIVLRIKQRLHSLEIIGGLGQNQCTWDNQGNGRGREITKVAQKEKC